MIRSKKPGLQMIIDYYTGGNDPGSAELRENPDYAAVIKKYKA